MNLPPGDHIPYWWGRILRDPFTFGLSPFQMAPFGLAGIWTTQLTVPANRPGLHKLAPRSQNKRGCLCC